MATKTYMVTERFRDGDPAPVYRRLREDGRMLPDGVEFVESWIDHALGRCFQVMRADSQALLEQWMANWDDLVEFEVCPVISSSEAAQRVAAMPGGPPEAL